MSHQANDDHEHAATDREPFSVQSDALDPTVAAELDAAYANKETVLYEGTPWLVQKVEVHRDPGPGAELKRFTLIPATEAAGGSKASEGEA